MNKQIKDLTDLELANYIVTKQQQLVSLQELTKIGFDELNLRNKSSLEKDFKEVKSKKKKKDN